MSSVDSTSTELFDEAVKVAEEADQVILFLGLNTDVEREGMDRGTLVLPGV